MFNFNMFLLHCMEFEGKKLRNQPGNIVANGRRSAGSWLSICNASMIVSVHYKMHFSILQASNDKNSVSDAILREQIYTAAHPIEPINSNGKLLPAHSVSAGPTEC